MTSKTDLFYNNRLYKLLSSRSFYSNETLYQLNLLLHQEPDLAALTHPKEGSYFHMISRNFHDQQNIAFRMVYALSNAGTNPNVTDDKGNTPLHEAVVHCPSEAKLDFIQALYRVGVDPRIMNHAGKTASAYIKDNGQLTTLFQGYGEGIWAAVEINNIHDTERLIKGFIKVDCKHSTNKTLLDKARDLNSPVLINILADYQITNEFVHSVLACDWDRASIIHEHKMGLLKVNAYDSIHRLTSVRKYSKPLLEYCLRTRSNKPLEILFKSSAVNIDVNIRCTDGLPFFFHCFCDFISDDIQRMILSNANLSAKSLNGETFLFHLISLYLKTNNKRFLNVFTNILYRHPMLLVQRNKQELTVIDYIEFSSSTVNYDRLRPFYDSIEKVLIRQLAKRSVIEEFILNDFGYYLLLFFQNKHLKMTKQVYSLLSSLQLHKDLVVFIEEFRQTIVDDNLTMFKMISIRRPKIFYSKDSFGRTCVHLIVLYQRYTMLQFICENYDGLIDIEDNLNRTCYHYACIMNDAKSMVILEQANSKQIPDYMNFYPHDYLHNRDLCCKRYLAYGFPEDELSKTSSSVSNYLKLAFYSSLKKAIETDSIDDIKLINKKIEQIGFHLNDLSLNSSVDDYVHGQRYTPLLFLALSHRSISAVKYLLELGVSLAGRIDASELFINKTSGLILFYGKSEETKYFDITDVINRLDDDDELKTILQPTKSCERLDNPADEQILSPRIEGNCNTNSSTCTIS